MKWFLINRSKKSSSKFSIYIEIRKNYCMCNYRYVIISLHNIVIPGESGKSLILDLVTSKSMKSHLLPFINFMVLVYQKCTYYLYNTLLWPCLFKYLIKKILFYRKTISFNPTTFH